MLAIAIISLSAWPAGSKSSAHLQLEDLASDLGVTPDPLPELKRVLSPWSREAQLEALSRIPATEATVRFVVLGDMEPGRFWITRILPPKKDAFKRLMRSLQAEEPEFILQLGDTVSRGTTENFAELETTLDSEVNRPFFPVVGNHDRPNTHGRSDKRLFNGIFGDGDFFFDRGGYRFILLDNSNWALTRSQLDWLDGVLQTPIKTVVSMHIPPTFLRGRFTKPHKTPKEPSSIKIKKGAAWFAQGAMEFGELMTRHGVKRVYMGHIHALAYADYQGVRYVLSGGGGSPLYRLPGMIPGKKTSHYIVVEAGPDGITERIETLKGETLTFLQP